MAKERLSLLQKHILAIHQEEYRRLNNKGRPLFTRRRIAYRLHSKTGKIYVIPRLNMDHVDREADSEILRKIPDVLGVEAGFQSGVIDEKTKDDLVEKIMNSLSPDAKELRVRRKDRTELHKDYDKRQVSLTRSLKSLVDKKYLHIRRTSYRKPYYSITEKGLNVKFKKDQIEHIG